MFGTLCSQSTRRLSRLAALAGALLILMALFAANPSIAQAQDTVTQVVKTNCYCYSKPSATAANQVDYLMFGTEVQVTGTSGKYSIISYDGQTCYVNSQNIQYKTKTVTKYSTEMKSAAKSSSETLGYVHYNDTLSVLGEENGYTHCYTSDGYEIYVKSQYLSDTATPKVTNMTTGLYSSPSNDAYVAKLTPGEEVTVSVSGKWWSKVTYKGETYYMYTPRLSNKVLRLSAERAPQLAKAQDGATRVQYVYWDKDCTILNTYETDLYGTYYYCKAAGKYGFIRVDYFGPTETMYVNRATNMYETASFNVGRVMSLAIGDAVSISYSNGTWTKASSDGNSGYVFAKYMSHKEYNVSGWSFESTYQAYMYSNNGTIGKSGQEISGTYEVIGTSSMFAKIKTDSGYRYVRIEDISEIVDDSSDGSIVYVNVPILNLYPQASTSDDTYTVPYMTQLEVVREVSSTTNGTWTQVLCDGQTYYMWTAAGSDSKVTSQKSTYSYTTTNDMQKSVVSTALDVFNNWKTEYVKGGTGTTLTSSGNYSFDCSGFASYVLNTAMQQYVPVWDVSSNLRTLKNTSVIYNEGITGQTSMQSVWKYGQTLDLSKLQAGDLVFFMLSTETGDNQDTVGYNHVGVYLGNGEFAHCTHTWNKVVIAPLKDIYLKGLVAVQRYLPSTLQSAGIQKQTTSTQTKLRSSMDSTSDSNIIATLDSDVVVTVEYVSSTQTWSYVDAGGQKGFVLSRYLTDVTQADEQTAYISTTSVKLYSSNSTKSDYVEAYCTEAVELKGLKSGTSYYCVSYNGEDRYIYVGDKSIDDVTTTDKETLLAGQGTKTLSANTYVRTTPSSSSDDNKIKLLKKGSSVTVIAVSDSGTWSYVEYDDGVYGFMLSKYLG